MASSEVVLLDFWGSPFCMRVKIALAEKGVAYESRQEDLFGGKSDLLLQSNPLYQKVPVLLHNGKPICESCNIVYYIDETWPTPPFLLPPSSYARSRARFWADYIEKKVFETGGQIWRGKGGEVEEAKDRFKELMKVLEGALGEEEYFNGDSFGFLDIIVIPMTSWFNAYETFGIFKVEDSFPKFAAWTKRCMERESVSKALPSPEKIIQLVINLRKMHGITD